MARKGGLGPLGHAAVARAAEVDRQHRSTHVASTVRANPAVTSTEAPDETPPDNWWAFDSSRVVEASYDSPADRLFVRFVKPDASVVYQYSGVTSNEWRNFRRSQSPGRYVNRVLNTKNYGPYRGS